jgi:GTP cyclohydrolase I
MSEKKKINKKLIEKSVRNILIALGDDPDREGLIDTPKRVARMYEEVFEGMLYTNEEIAKMFDKCFEDTTMGDLVVVDEIPIFSYCEHHMALMYDLTVSVAYIPKGRVIGLSKIARIADMVGKRLQLQERIGSDIMEILQTILNTDDVAVVIQGRHSCMSARGIKKPSITRTCALGGEFRKNAALRQELYSNVTHKN